MEWAYAFTLIYLQPNSRAAHIEKGFTIEPITQYRCYKRSFGNSLAPKVLGKTKNRVNLMKGMKSITRLLLCGACIALGTANFNLLPASASQLGQSCKHGQTSVITMPVNIRVSLVCTKVGNLWKFTNADGKLHLTKYTVTVAESQKPYRMYLPILGGKPPYQCALANDSTLPNGFNYAHAGQVINGVWNCVIASGSVPALAPGTTKYVTPPFIMTFNDASSPIQRTTVKLQITIIASGPQVQVIAGGTCTVGVACDVLMATARGGIPPYTFRLDTLLAGAPPMGMTFGTDGHLRGTPSVAGTSILGVCVVDSTGAYDCNGSQIQVNPAQVVESGPQLSDLNGDFNGSFDPTWQFDDVTVLHQLIPFKFHINNGQITGDLTGQITWSPPDGNASVTLPIVISSKTAVCSSVWGWHVGANRQVTLQAALTCRGANIYNSGTVTVTKL